MKGPTTIATWKVMGAALVPAALAATASAAVQQWMDYFQPTPIISPLSSSCWGAAQVGPRDQSNGLEDKTMKSWNYWDGGIIKDEATGTYHMFASRWSRRTATTGGCPIRTVSMPPAPTSMDPIPTRVCASPTTEVCATT